MRGRKLRAESRGTELRARLAEWKQIPEFSRPSLRALARDLGTSHQLLAFYLKGLEKWQGEECLRRAKEIRARASAEGRFLTRWEEQQVHSYNKAGISLMAGAIIVDDIRSIKEESERRSLAWHEVKALRIYASKFPEAQELLQKCLQNGIKKRKRFAEIVKETPRQAGETCSAWVRRIRDQCSKYDTKCPAVITEELLDRCSQSSAKRQKNNLPVISPSAAKSFKRA